MKVLRIFDVMPFVHAGKVNGRAYLLPDLDVSLSAFTDSKIFCGGASLIWNILYQYMGTCDMAFCLDESPTIKRAMYPAYKGNRNFNTELGKQKEACYHILRDCGFTTLIDDGYEADDFIYSLVMEYKKYYDHIYVYTGDSDLYMLVDDNVTILPSSSRAKEVTRANFTYTARKGVYTPYNALTFYKIISGDTSDNIKGLGGELAGKLRRLYDNEMFHPILANKEAMIALLAESGERARKQAELIFPLDTWIPENFLPGDKQRVAEWGSAFNNSLYKTPSPVSAHVAEQIEYMAAQGWATTAQRGY